MFYGDTGITTRKRNFRVNLPIYSYCVLIKSECCWVIGDSVLAKYFFLNLVQLCYLTRFQILYGMDDPPTIIVYTLRPEVSRKRFVY